MRIIILVLILLLALPVQAYSSSRFYGRYLPTQSEWLCTYINSQLGITTNEVQIRAKTTKEPNVVVIEARYLIERIPEDYVKREIETMKQFAAKYVQLRGFKLFIETKLMPFYGTGEEKFPDVNDIMVTAVLRELDTGTNGE